MRTGTPDSIQAAIDQGADVNGINKDGWTTLMVAAAFNRSAEMIITLLKAGADVNAGTSAAPLH